jgi:hypothetical protein
LKKMLHRASYLAVALTLGMLLTLGMGALEKQRHAAQTVTESPAIAERPSAGDSSLAAVQNAQPQVSPESEISEDSDVVADQAPPAVQTTAGPTASEPTAADLEIEVLVEELQPSPIEYLASAATGGATSADAAPNTAAKPAPEPDLYWHDDYEQAWNEAKEDGRMLFIYFHDATTSATRRSFENNSLARPDIKAKLADFVLLKLPVDATISSGGESKKLLRHPAFAEMLGRPGIAIVDLAHRKAEYYERVVSTFPFVRGKYYRGPVVDAILALPPGTLTQRTMIYAVRTHPEAPASTQGKFNNVLAEEAKLQSDYQATILTQGHQNWENRFHRINARLPGGATAQEVVAESWPNESLVDACVDCVDSWRQSPGHWSAVRSRQAHFGFDIKRGRNGIWYATGIFGRR